MRAAILTYHSLDDDGSVISVTPRIFASQMQSLATAGVRVVPLETLIAARPAATAAADDAPRVAITFDDGFHNLCEHAVPVLTRLHFPATVFVVSEWCGRDNTWPTQPTAVKRRPLLGWKELRAMRANGWDIGSHSRNHPVLPGLDDDALADELGGSRRRLEEEVQAPVTTFAYPYGIMDVRVRAAAKRHFALACGTRFGYLRKGEDAHALPRLDMYYFRHTPDISHLFAPSGRTYVAFRAALRAGRRLALGAQV